MRRFSLWTDPWAECNCDMVEGNDGSYLTYTDFQEYQKNKQIEINLLHTKIEDLENEIRNLRTSKSCGCKSGQ